MRDVHNGIGRISQTDWRKRLAIINDTTCGWLRDTLRRQSAGRASNEAVKGGQNIIPILRRRVTCDDSTTSELAALLRQDNLLHLPRGCGEVVSMPSTVNLMATAERACNYERDTCN